MHAFDPVMLGTAPATVACGAGGTIPGSEMLPVQVPAASTAES